MKYLLVVILVMGFSGCMPVDENPDIFAKNVECEAYKTSLATDLESKNTDRLQTELIAVYYHENLDTCVYTTMSFFYDESYNLIDLDVGLFDLFTKKLIAEPYGDELYQDFVERTLLDY